MGSGIGTSTVASLPAAVPFVDLAAQHAALRPELERAFSDLITDCNFILGEPVARFEEAFATFVGARHAVGVANGLDALRLTLLALDIGPGDEVILPANTFIATALAVSGVGARVVLVDCDGGTFNIDVGRIDAAITPRTRAIVPVHLTGQAADIDPILEIAGRRGLAVVEDAAQAHGARYKNRPCGSLAAAAGFSFYPGKNLGACGDGGAVTTNDDRLAMRVRQLRNYGQEVKYQHVEQGTNSRLDTLQAAILSIKLRRLPAWNEARRRHAEAYRTLLAGAGDLVFQDEAPYSSHVHHLFIVQTARRDALQAHLRAARVDAIIHYPIPIHLQPAYASLGHRAGDFPVAEQLARRVLSLPMYPELTPDAIERVAGAVRACF